MCTAMLLMDIKLGNGFAHSGTCKKCKADLESIIRKVVKEERSQW